MKVLGPRYMGEYALRNAGNARSHGKDCILSFLGSLKMRGTSWVLWGRGELLVFGRVNSPCHCGQEIQKIEEGYRNLPGDLERDGGLAVETQKSTPLSQ